MRSEESSIWRRIGFKVVQILLACHTFFISFRTLDYVTGSGSGSSGTDKDEDGDMDMDMDLVPMMLSFTAVYPTIPIIGSIIFDAGRSLNTKVYNQKSNPPYSR